MKILLKFITSNNKIPIEYRKVFLSFFKKALSGIAEGKYYDRFYASPQRHPFTFAVRLPRPNFSKEEILIEKNELQLIFSTADSMTGFIFMSAFIAQKGKLFNAPLSNTFTLSSVSQVKEKTVFSNSALIKMQSPLCLREHCRESNKDTYVSVASNEFAEKSQKILKEQLLSENFSEKLASEVSIVPVNAKKTVVYHYGCAIECSIGEFVINADKSIINYFLKSGIGSRKSSGFGCVELIASDEQEV